MTAWSVVRGISFHWNVMVLETSSMLAVTRLYIFIVTESSFVIGVTVFSRHFVMTFFVS